jgi:uncharacterized protein (TIGR03086 family)
LVDRIIMLQRAVDGANRVVSGLQADELTKPTPCTDWDVKALVDHMAWVLATFTAAIDDTEPPPKSADLLGGDLAASYARVSQKAVDAWRIPGTLERTLTIPLGEMPAPVALNVMIADQHLHTWDLSKSLGRPHTMDEDLSAAVLGVMQQMLKPEYRGPGKGFGAVVPWPEDAPVQERLLAFSGRQP